MTVPQPEYSAPHNTSTTAVTASATEEHPRVPRRSQRSNRHSLQRETNWSTQLLFVLWPIAIGFIIKRFSRGIAGGSTDDFYPVFSALRRFWDQEVLYSGDYDSYSPHYLYSPGGTLFLSPLAFSPEIDVARNFLAVVNTLCIIGAIAIFVRLFGYSLKGFVFPLALIATFWSESVSSTIAFGNVNGILLFFLACFFYFVMKGNRWVVGICVGCLILVKPSFAVLLFIPLVLLWWPSFITAAAVFLGFNALGWVFVVEASDYFDVVVPYLGEPRDYFNTSWPGMMASFGYDGFWATFFWLLFAGLIGCGLLAILFIRNQDRLLWLTLSSTLLLLGSFFLSSLGQGYYSLFLIPIFFTVGQTITPANSAWAWVAFFAAYSPDTIALADWPYGSYYITMTAATFAWGILLVLTAAYCIAIFLRARKPQEFLRATSPKEAIKAIT